MGQQYLIGPGVDIVGWNIAVATDGSHLAGISRQTPCDQDSNGIRRA